jgi:uncharacterized protein with FMN-binding domain
MKRLIVSVVVVVAFTVYAIFSRGDSTAPTAITTDVVAPTSSSGSIQITSSASSSGYADGTYTGSKADAMYGTVQVQVVIQGGRITDVQFLSRPSGREESDQINSYAAPILVQETIAAQSADVQVVSGATLTSRAFMQSLQSALDQA